MAFFFQFANGYILPFATSTIVEKKCFSFFLDCQKWSHAQRRLLSLNSSIENSAVINDSVLKLVL
jgi:hypothetical protein